MFAKLFQSMYDGSLGTRGPWEALVTFQQLLILADRFGDVDVTAEAISRRTMIPLNIIEKGIAELLKPDPESRDAKEEGRRIVPIADHRNWGWHIVNYTRYAAIRSAEERREYKARYYREKVAPKRKGANGGEGDGDWCRTEESTMATGKTLQMPPRPGESMAEYKARLFAKIKKRKGGTSGKFDE